jgi:transglutaminase-like putative cysteine protease
MKKRIMIFSLVVLLAINFFPSIVFAENRTSQYTIENETVIRVEGEIRNIEIEIDVLSPQYLDGLSSYYQVKQLAIKPNPTEIRTDQYGNMKAVYKLARLDRDFLIKQIALVDFKDHQFTPSYSYKSNSSENHKKYLLPSAKIESNDPRILAKAKQLTEGITDPYQKAKKIYEFVQMYLTYDNGVYANKGALSALTTGKGVCEEFASLMVALLRASGVPARTVSGYWLKSIDLQYSNSRHLLEDGSILLSKDNYEHGLHQWCEYYLEGEGWIPAEPTVDYQYNGEKQVHWDSFYKLGKGKDVYLITGYNNNGSVRSRSLSYSPLNNSRAEIGTSLIKLHKGYKVVPSDYQPLNLNGLPTGVSSSIKLKIDGIIVQTDVDPLMENNRVLVPVRVVCDNLGASADWNDLTKQAIIRTTGQKLVLTANKNIASINGLEKMLDAPAKIVNGRFLVPLRFVAESFGAQVSWDPIDRVAIIEGA